MRSEGDVYVQQENGIWRQVTNFEELEALAKKAADSGPTLTIRWFQRPGVGG